MTKTTTAKKTTTTAKASDFAARMAAAKAAKKAAAAAPAKKPDPLQSSELADLLGHTGLVPPKKPSKAKPAPRAVGKKPEHAAPYGTTAAPALQDAPKGGIALDTLRKQVPAAFATVASSKVSDRYQFISSEEVINRMLKEGFVPVRAMQNRSRTEEDMLTTRHMIRFRRTDAKPLLGEVVPEVGFVNGHNGNVRFELFGGLYRLVCSNGLVAKVGNSATSIGTKHMGDIGHIVESSYKIIEDMAELTGKVEALQRIAMPEEYLLPFAGNAAALAFGEDHQLAKEPAPLLMARRDADKADNVWTVFNRVQENLIRGGMQYQSANGRAVSTKGITRVKRDVELNIQLWDLAEQVASQLDGKFRKMVGADLLA